MRPERVTAFWTLTVGALIGVATATIVWSYAFMATRDDGVKATADTTTAAADTTTAAANTATTQLSERFIDGARVVRIEATDWAWQPDTIELSTGEPVVLEITNTGAYPHGIWIPDLGINVDTPAGETVLVEVMPQRPGEFMLGCNNDLCGTEAQHEGMTGRVVVVGDPVAATTTTTATASESSAPTTTVATADSSTSTTGNTPTAEAVSGAVVAAIDLIDTSGFHGLTEQIEAAGSLGAIDPGHLATTARALAVARTITWPDELAAETDAFITDADALATALASGDLPAAQTAAGSLHVTQHDLSEATYTWLETQTG